MKISLMPKMHMQSFISTIGIKSQVIKWISVLLISVLLVGSLSGCDLSYLFSSYDSAETIIDRMIPFADKPSHWGKWNNLTLLEEDEYGRQLFLSITVEPHYKVFSDFSGNTIYTYIVVQAETESTLFCYPDLCYQYAPSDSSTEIINQIKADNDWEKPLELQKMIALPIGTKKLKHLSSYDTDAIRSAMYEDRSLFDHIYIDVVYSSNDEPFFVLREVLQRDQLPYTFGRAWIVSVDDSNCLKAYAELGKHPCDWAKPINQFITDHSETGNSQ